MWGLATRTGFSAYGGRPDLEPARRHAAEVEETLGAQWSDCLRGRSVARDISRVAVYPFCTHLGWPRWRRTENRLQTTNAPSRIRTCGLLLRRESLYPAELSGPGVRLVRILGIEEGRRPPIQVGCPPWREGPRPPSA
jgi:hypothetical protein